MPEEEISIWLDEKEDGHAKRKTLNKTFESVTDGRTSPVQSTLNTEWDNISTTQQKYYLRRTKELQMTATLSVISSGQEERLWGSLRGEHLRKENLESKQKHFDLKSDLIDALVKAHEEAQT